MITDPLREVDNGKRSNGYEERGDWQVREKIIRQATPKNDFQGAGVYRKTGEEEITRIWPNLLFAFPDLIVFREDDGGKLFI
jgi:hypothetical protein